MDNICLEKLISMIRKRTHVEKVGAGSHFLDVYTHETSLFCSCQIKFTFSSNS